MREVPYPFSAQIIELDRAFVFEGDIFRSFGLADACVNSAGMSEREIRSWQKAAGRYPDRQVSSIISPRSIAQVRTNGQIVHLRRVLEFRTGVLERPVPNEELSAALSGLSFKSVLSILYQGQYSPDGLEVAGSWKVLPRGLWGKFFKPESGGSFQLFYEGPPFPQDSKDA